MKPTVIRRKRQTPKAPFSGKRRIVVTCAKGILPYLKQEILSLGFPILASFVAGVETEGTFEDTLKLNLYLRTGQRVRIVEKVRLLAGIKVIRRPAKRHADAPKISCTDGGDRNILAIGDDSFEVLSTNGKTN